MKEANRAGKVVRFPESFLKETGGATKRIVQGE